MLKLFFIFIVFVNISLLASSNIDYTKEEFSEKRNKRV